MDDTKQLGVLEPLILKVQSASAAYIEHFGYMKLLNDAQSNGPERVYRNLANDKGEIWTTRAPAAEENAEHERKIHEYSEAVRRVEPLAHSAVAEAIASITTGVSKAVAGIVDAPQRFTVDLESALHNLSRLLLWAWNDVSGQESETTRWNAAIHVSNLITPVTTHVRILKRGALLDSDHSVQPFGNLSDDVEAAYVKHGSARLILQVLTASAGANGRWSHQTKAGDSKPSDLLPSTVLHMGGGGGDAILNDDNVLLFGFVGNPPCDEARDAFIGLSRRIGARLSTGISKALGLKYEPEPMVLWWMFMLIRLSDNPNFVQHGPTWRAILNPFGAMAHAFNMLPSPKPAGASIESKSTPTDRISQADAADLVTCSDKTIGRRIDDGTIAGFGAKGARKVSKAEVLAKADAIRERKPRKSART